MKKSIASSAGFTLIEVLIVITLIVVLASMGMASYTNSVQRSREAVLREDLFRMRDAIDQYYADKNKYPQALADLVTEKYLREIPKDPITNSADTWTTVPAEVGSQSAPAKRLRRQSVRGCRSTEPRPLGVSDGGNLVIC
jgi:general secretion pathway protein G